VERAAAAIDETVHLITREKTEILFVDGIESPRALRAGLRVGMRCPAHCTAAGKLLLSQLPEQEVRSLYRSSRLKPRTENSITTRAELEAELQRVREQGWAEAAGENEAEIAAVSVLVGDPTLGVQGALSYSVPLSRYDRSTRTKLVTELLEITGQDRPSTPDLRP
jgi:DNA-binding IclR family transcriptional regulator